MARYKIEYTPVGSSEAQQIDIALEKWNFADGNSKESNAWANGHWAIALTGSVDELGQALCLAIADDPSVGGASPAHIRTADRFVIPLFLDCEDNDDGNVDAIKNLKEKVKTFFRDADNITFVVEQENGESLDFAEEQAKIRDAFFSELDGVGVIQPGNDLGKTDREEEKPGSTKYIAISVIFALIALVFLAGTVFNLAAISGKEASATHPMVAMALAPFHALHNWASGVSVDVWLGLAAAAFVGFLLTAIIVAAINGILAHQTDSALGDADDEFAELNKEDHAVYDRKFYENSIFYGSLAFVGTLVTLGTLLVFTMGLVAILSGAGVNAGAFGTFVENAGFLNISDLALGLITAATPFVAAFFGYLTYKAGERSDQIRKNDGGVAQEVQPFHEAVVVPIANAVTSVVGTFPSLFSAAQGRVDDAEYHRIDVDEDEDRSDADAERADVVAAVQQQPADGTPSATS